MECEKKSIFEINFIILCLIHRSILYEQINFTGTWIILNIYFENMNT